MKTYGKHKILLTSLLLIFPAIYFSCSTPQKPVVQEDTKKTALPYKDKAYTLDVQWGASPKTVMLKLFDVAKLDKNDIFYDLGCGDGRVVVEAVKRYGLLGKGVDIDPARIVQSRELAAKAGVEKRAIFYNESFFDTDFSDATVMFLFLNNKLNKKLRPGFLKVMKPGSRIIMHTHDMGEWKPDFSQNIKCECVKTGKFECFRTARMYIVPANVTGVWSWKIDNKAEGIAVKQKFQVITGELTSGAEKIKPRVMKISGTRISMTLEKKENGVPVKLSYEGTVSGDTITGTVTVLTNGVTVTKNWNAKRDTATRVSIEM